MNIDVNNSAYRISFWSKILNIISHNVPNYPIYSTIVRRLNQAKRGQDSIIDDSHNSVLSSQQCAIDVSLIKMLRKYLPKKLDNALVCLIHKLCLQGINVVPLVTGANNEFESISYCYDNTDFQFGKSAHKRKHKHNTPTMGHIKKTISPDNQHHTNVPDKEHNRKLAIHRRAHSNIFFICVYTIFSLCVLLTIFFISLLS